MHHCNRVIPQATDILIQRLELGLIRDPVGRHAVVELILEVHERCLDAIDLMN